ncbi:MAG TPA: acetate kinase [Polyangiaceae bacterium]|nr:acetate kinase [Polyangiaceae bacterium]
MGQPQVLVFNAGSSSFKCARIEPTTGRVLDSALAERLGQPGARLMLKRGEGDRQTWELPQLDHGGALRHVLERIDTSALVAVGHRVVHGGEAFVGSSVIDARALRAIDDMQSLAPLHNPANALGIREAMRLLPRLPQVAVFDTAYHQTMPPEAFLYAVPYELYEQHALRRYGFHGSSHRYVAGLAAERLAQPLEALSLVTAHLGNGCSACAIRKGKSVDTTMGLTPLEGLVMGTRSGDVDPNLFGFLRDHIGSTLEQSAQLLNHESGLLGLSGVSNDMRRLLELEAEGHERARLAVLVFCHRLAKGILGLCASLARIDAIVFTGGIGENAARVRELTLERLAVLGVEVDRELNAEHGAAAGGRITTAASALRAFVVPTNEELIIAREALSCIGTDACAPSNPRPSCGLTGPQE